MKVIRKNEGTPYEAGGHFNCWCTRKISDKETARTSVSVTHFLPNGGLNMSGSPQEKVYVVLAGALALKTKSGEEATLQAGDIAFFAGGEEREGHAVGTDPCTILVCIVKP